MNTPLNLKYTDKLLVRVTLFISVTAFVYFYFHGQENLAYYDAIARLNTARKMIDSITPGIGQLGGIWLPFPQILFIPFIWNNFLWHTGIAGYIISGSSFVLGALYLQKAVFALTQNRKVALLIWFVFVSNLNILLLQTMAMSETFFLCFFILTIYHLIIWTKEHKLSNFLLIAFCLMILSLTRYEGDFVLFGVFLSVVIECIRFYKINKRDQIEGLLLIFLTVAGFGIILWCIYSALFYKDPFFWLHSYTPPSVSVIQTKNTLTDQTYGILNPTPLQSLEIYSSIMLLTNGVMTSMLAALGLLFYCLRPNKKFFSLALISIVLFIFLVVGYYKGFIPHIEFPPILLTGKRARDWSHFADNNIRYGVVILPCMLFFLALTAAKNKIFFAIVASLIAIQIIFSFTNSSFLQYSFYKAWKYPHDTGIQWFRNHYDGKLILIAASRHEDFMFQSNLAYHDFVYEGTRKHWYDSLNKPSDNVSWVIFDDGLPDDDVTEGLTKSGVSDLKKNFNKVYQNKTFLIYELKP
jgi:hypothetical protein